jgi:hypothetical protein
MTDPSPPLSDPRSLEGDEVLKPPFLDDIDGDASVAGPDGDPGPGAAAEDPEGADD